MLRAGPANLQVHAGCMCLLIIFMPALGCLRGRVALDALEGARMLRGVRCLSRVQGGECDLRAAVRVRVDVGRGSRVPLLC